MFYEIFRGCGSQQTFVLVSTQVADVRLSDCVHRGMFNLSADS